MESKQRTRLNMVDKVHRNQMALSAVRFCLNSIEFLSHLLRSCLMTWKKLENPSSSKSFIRSTTLTLRFVSLLRKASPALTDSSKKER